jgi:pyruvate-formate lyase
MNGAFTPKLIKNLKGAMKAKHAGSVLRKLEKDTAVVGNNRVDNVLMKNGDKQEGVVMEASRDTNKIIYPEITSRDSTNIRGAYEYLKSPNKQQILDNSRSSATVEEADKYNLSKLRTYAKQYGLDAVKGVRDYFGFGPKNN